MRAALLLLLLVIGLASAHATDTASEPPDLDALRSRLTSPDARAALDACRRDGTDPATCAATAETRQRLDDAAARQEEEARVYWAERAEEARPAARAACEDTAAYRRFAAARRFQSARTLHAMAEASLDRDAAIEKAGGVPDLRLRANVGQSLAETAADLEKEWTVYRQNGGTASSPDALATEPTLDPCTADIPLD